MSPKELLYVEAVSYTQLDVYKRQRQTGRESGILPRGGDVVRPRGRDRTAERRLRGALHLSLIHICGSGGSGGSGGHGDGGGGGNAELLLEFLHEVGKLQNLSLIHIFIPTL